MVPSVFLFPCQPLLQFGDTRFQLPEFLICHFGFPVQITALGVDAVLLYSGSSNA
ncbi:MAG: hypothetical protein K2N63_00910 [Lachnospiraceae bacterium]|nr:hypothetical protein [Lachnospiraceae bacterium]